MGLFKKKKDFEEIENSLKKVKKKIDKDPGIFQRFKASKELKTCLKCGKEFRESDKSKLQQIIRMATLKQYGWIWESLGDPNLVCNECIKEDLKPIAKGFGYKK